MNTEITSFMVTKSHGTASMCSGFKNAIGFVEAQMKRVTWPSLRVYITTVTVVTLGTKKFCHHFSFYFFCPSNCDQT